MRVSQVRGSKKRKENGLDTTIFCLFFPFPLSSCSQFPVALSPSALAIYLAFESQAE
jgi:hypothetical protein